MAEQYVVYGTVRYGYPAPRGGVREFKHGETLTPEDLDPADREEQIAEMRRLGVLHTPGEVMTAEQIDARLAEYERLKAEVEALKAAQAAGMGGQRTADLLAEAEAEAEAAEPVAGKSSKSRK